MIVTTSWDDGHPADERLLALLSERGIRATFYIPRQHPLFGSVDEDLVRKLHGDGMEIGAHTMTHPDMRSLPSDHAEREARSSKDWLELLTGRAVTMFSYPFGKSDRRTRHVVQSAGFAGARGLRYNGMRRHVDPFRLGITVQER